MITYTQGLTLKAEKNITKNDIITMCKLLNGKNEYFNLCEFQPEPITEGGIVFKFKDGSNTKWYKSVRLGIRGKWPRIPNNVMTDWNENNEILIETNYKFTTFLKSFHGAPL